MIEWKKYDQTNKPNYDTHYLISNGTWVANAVLSEIPNVDYDWTSENGPVRGVTHYAEINLPQG